MKYSAVQCLKKCTEMSLGCKVAECLTQYCVYWDYWTNVDNMDQC